MKWAKLILALLLIVAFGLLFSQEKWLALVLLLCAFLLAFLSLWRQTYDQILDWFGLRNGNQGKKYWFLIAIVCSLALAIFYRFILGMDWHPVRLTPFLLTAVLIGTTEELVFRGYFYGAFIHKPIGAITFSAIAHTACKTAIFIPYQEITLWRLAAFTFLTGLFLGWMRSARQYLALHSLSHPI